jgi:hypothetical protein
MKTWMLLGFLIFGVATAEAKIIVIADIDDTIKQSNVLDTDEAMQNALATDVVFLGMNWLLQEVKTYNEGISFYYVTNAPADLMQSLHTTFLRDNQFPAGALRLRQSFFDKNFKLTEIRKILNQEKPDVVVALGDNGEKDAAVYEQLRREFPAVQWITYIHQVYNSRSYDEQGSGLFPSQIGFVTAMDLAVNFYLNGLLPSEYLGNFLGSFAPQFLTEIFESDRDVVAIPHWMDCRDFSWNINDSVLAGDLVFMKVKDKIRGRCAVPPHRY